MPWLGRAASQALGRMAYLDHDTGCLLRELSFTCIWFSMACAFSCIFCMKQPVKHSKQPGPTSPVTFCSSSFLRLHVRDLSICPVSHFELIYTRSNSNGFWFTAQKTPTMAPRRNSKSNVKKTTTKTNAQKASAEKTTAKKTPTKKTSAKKIGTKSTTAPTGTRHWDNSSKLVSGGALGEMSKARSL